MTEIISPPCIAGIEADVAGSADTRLLILAPSTVREMVAYVRSLEAEVARLKARVRGTVYADEVGDWRRMVL